MAALAVVASCSTTVKTDTASSSTTTGARDATTVVETTAPPTTVAPLTKADLERLLPVASDVGAGYEMIDESDSGSDSGDGEFDKVMADACPSLVDLIGAPENNSDSPDKAERSFSTEDGRTVSVELDPDLTDAKVTSAAEMRKVVDAVNSCDNLKFSNNGVDFTMSLTMRTDKTFGDFGGILELSVHGESAQLPKPLDLNGVVRMFVSHGVGVTVSAMGGVDTETFDAVPADSDAVETIAKQITDALGDI